MVTTAGRVPFVDLEVQDREIRGEIEAEVLRVLRSTAFVLGPEVSEFEREFGSFLGVRHAIGVANGTDALLLALKAVGVGPGDAVVVPANTFVATAEAVIHAGARLVLVDVDPRTYTIDVERLEAAMTPSVKAIIPVHLYGAPADLAPILRLARERGVAVVEDAAQAAGAEYRGRRVGSWGHAACFSFYPAKNLGAYGDAGAVVTDDDGIAAAVRRLRNHGGIEKYRHDLVGWNSRLDTVQAAVLRVKLRYLDEWNRMRERIARQYDNLLSDVSGIAAPRVGEDGRHAYHLYVVRVEGGARDALREDLGARGIETAVHYPSPLHLTPAFASLQCGRGAFPVAERCAEQVLSLPMYPGLTDHQIGFVADAISRFMRHHASVPQSSAGPEGTTEITA